MLSLRSKLILISCVVAAFALLGWAYVSSEKSGAVAEHSAKTAVEAISRAEETRKGDLKADARVASENRARLDSVRSMTRKAELHEVHTGSAGAACAVDPADVRLLNDAIGAANAAIESSRSLP